MCAFVYILILDGAAILAMPANLLMGVFELLPGTKSIVAKLQNPEKWLRATRLDIAFGRIAGAGCVATYLLLITFFLEVHVLSPRGRFLPILLVMTEYKAEGPCKKSGELIAFLKDDTYSVAVPTPKGSFKFETRKCEETP